MNFNSPDMDQFIDDIAQRALEAGVFDNPQRALQNKPDRETVINRDDVTNLKIALGTADSLESFLEMV